MKQYTSKEFIRIVKKNGFVLNRYNGDHAIFVNDKGRHISIPKKLECVIARRLIKENNLNIDIKNKKKMSESGYYPPGAEQDPTAPFNEKTPKFVEAEVFISITMSKTFIVKVSEEDLENGTLDKDVVVNNNIILPTTVPMALEEAVTEKQKKKLMDDVSDWDVDDYEVLIDKK